MSKKIAVVMAVRNAGPYLVPQLQSILLQSQQVDVVYYLDDGSTDGSAETLAYYSKRHPGRFEIVEALDRPPETS